jgi:SAM-dependent methyltransferase
MAIVDQFNLSLVKSVEEVDQINKKFYGKFNYPWPPGIFPGYPPGIAELFLNQAIGYWGHDRIVSKPKILVAGCGTNQALYTALRYPLSEVIGVDISTQSLNTCRRNADQIGVKNLTLVEKSLNGLDFKEEFDYVICTGVVHHNADPQGTLGKIAAALKKNGILEFMVYNYYHRLLTTACQKAIRSFNTVPGRMDLNDELLLIRSLMNGFPYHNFIGQFLRSYKETHDSDMADTMLQPVEYSYTIETLRALAEGCNLEYLVYCPNQFDVNNERTSWNINLGDASLQERYDMLPDVVRWQITNLLMFSESPMLWFYFQRKDSDHPRKPERDICETFLDTRFTRSSFPVKNYVLNDAGDYVQSNKVTKYPLVETHCDQLAKKVLSQIDGNLTIRDILFKLDLQPGFKEISDLRIRLTTLSFPYLLSTI